MARRKTTEIIEPVAIEATDLSPDDPMWTIADLAAYVRYPVDTIRTWRSQGRAPHAFRINGGELRFLRSDVAAWLKKQREDGAEAS